MRRLAATIAPVRQAVTLLPNRLAGPAFAGRVCERGAVSEAAVAVFFATGPETYTSSSSGGSPWMRSGLLGCSRGWRGGGQDPRTARRSGRSGAARGLTYHYFGDVSAQQSTKRFEDAIERAYQIQQSSTS